MHRLSMASRVELTRIVIQQAGDGPGRITHLDDVEGPGRDDTEPVAGPQDQA